MEEKRKRGRPRVNAPKEKKPAGRPRRWEEPLVKLTIWTPMAAKEGLRLLIKEYLDIYEMQNKLNHDHPIH